MVAIRQFVSSYVAGRWIVPGLPRLQLADWRGGPMGRSLGRLGRLLQAPAGVKPLNLALQGGGAHGAFTWGVLDRLLEDGRFRFGAVSGTSAGAMNAVILAAGLLDGGRDGARARLEAFWRAVGEAARFSPLRSSAFDRNGAAPRREFSASHMAFDMMTRWLSPYQFNPLDYNPLRDLLERSVDFKRLRRESRLQLYLSATDVADGKTRVFRTAELSIEAVLASACLPQMHRAVKVGRRHYWDGGYSANPALMPLVRDGAADTLLVQINPTSEAALPTTAQGIAGRVNRIVFNEPLRREIELIAHGRALATEGFSIGGRLRGRLRRHRFHHIEAAKYTEDLGEASKMSPDWTLLAHLRDCGRAAADGWLRKHYRSVGRRATVDLAAKFL